MSRYDDDGPNDHQWATSKRNWDTVQQRLARGNCQEAFFAFTHALESDAVMETAFSGDHVEGMRAFRRVCLIGGAGMDGYSKRRRKRSRR